MRPTLPAILLVLLIAACGGSDADSATTTTTAASSTSVAETTTSVADTTTTTAAAATTAAAGSITIDDDRVVTIDWESLGDVFFAAPVPSADDPFYFVHTDPATDGFFLGVEAYTVYGPGWTGQTGVFEIDCGANGICIHFDPDGPGPEGDLGADFMVTGTIEIVQADFDGFEAILTNVAFSDGTTIPGPLTVTGGSTG